MTASARLFVLAGACAALVSVPSAQAAGPPLPSSASGRAGAVAPGGSERLLTRRAGRDTLVVAVRRDSGRVLRSHRIRGRWSIPAATLTDEGTTGLSADGRTLVLARPTRTFPPPSTPLAVLDARTLHVRRELELRGFFTVDAISPDGRWLYLIQYRGDDVLDYRVRALDTRTGGLVRKAVVDPRDPGEQMGGVPVTRALSPDGRWAYTLYSGGEETFIHALDTVGRTAACIDLDMIPADGDFDGLRLDVTGHGRHVEVRDVGRLLAIVDTRSLRVSEPGAAPAPPRRAIAPPAADEDDGGLGWPVLLLLGAAAALAVVLAWRRAPRRGVARRA